MTARVQKPRAQGHALYVTFELPGVRENGASSPDCTWDITAKLNTQLLPDIPDLDISVCPMADRNDKFSLHANLCPRRLMSPAELPCKRRSIISPTQVWGVTRSPHRRRHRSEAQPLRRARP